MNQINLKSISVLVICLLIQTIVFSQAISPWKIDASVAKGKITFLETPKSVSLPTSDKNFQLSVPTPQGDNSIFDVRESHVMPARLAAKYPNIKSYLGQNKDGQIIALTEYNGQLSVFVKGNGPSWGIEQINDTQARMGYNKDLTGDFIAPPLSCGHVADEDDFSKAKGLPNFNPEHSKSTAVPVHKYVMALACTGEYGQRRRTKANVMQSFVEGINILNAITRSEVGVYFELHPNTDTLIFLDPATDPYVDADLGRALLGQNPIAINARMSVDSYNIGHVFTNACQDVGGVVSGRTCTRTGKARGVTCHYSNLRHIIENVTAHEAAHQFGVSHSWNNCPGNDGQRASVGAYEPGSGSTIMSYQGSCGSANNVSTTNNDEPYYHVVSLNQYKDFIATTGDCAETTNSTNNYPEIAWPYTNGFSIPVGTPFVLEASATDPDGDKLIYIWEQYDLGGAVDLCEQTPEGPLFRSFTPTESGSKRYFPSKITVITNRNDCSEQLPAYARELNFRFTARDRNVASGGSVWQQLTFNVVDNGGPFKVTSQKSASETYIAGGTMDVTWNVSGTNEAPVNCERVNILLSLDNGRTFPHVLATETLNDGSEQVTLPVVDGTLARVKIEAVDNIFYSLCASKFSIVEPTVPGFTFVPSTTGEVICLPASPEIKFYSSSLLQYDSTINVEVLSSVPADVPVSLSKNQIKPGDSIALNVDFSNFNRQDSVIINVRAIGQNADTAVRKISLLAISNDFSDLKLMEPAQAAVGISGNPTFKFTPSQNGQKHLLQVSSSPDFRRGAIEIENPDPSGQTLNEILPSNEVFFWRVIPSNNCGIAYDASPVYSFHTYATKCEKFSLEEPVTLPSNIRKTVESVIDISETGEVSDLNLPNVNVKFNDISKLNIKLLSPDGTEAILFGRRCTGINILNTGFDDESPIPLRCSPAPSDGQIRKPQNPLSIFTGKQIQGEWKLQVEVAEPSSISGSFKNFEMEFCANISSQAPTIKVDTLKVPTNSFQYINLETLQANDPDNSMSDLQCIVYTKPKHGYITFLGERLEVGDKFDLGNANAGGVKYHDQRGEDGSDEFELVLTDGAGNIIPRFKVPVLIGSQYATVNTKELESSIGVVLYPNPTSGISTFELSEASNGGTLTITDSKGRLIENLTVGQGKAKVTINASKWAKGLYFVQYTSEGAFKVARLVVQ